MYRIISNEQLNPSVIRVVLHAPYVARRCEPGQFIMLRVHEKGERIPLTIADFDRAQGTVTVVVQVIGKTTRLLADARDAVCDVAGPLGHPSPLEGIRDAAVIGGGLGCAIAYPQAKKLKELGARVDVISGFRTRELVFFQEELRAAGERLFTVTDDGSFGEKGLVTDKLRALIDGGRAYDAVIAIGPLIMMKFVSLLTREYGIKTLVSLNPVMVDGTGMCGGCRVTVGGETKFACVDGPDFDGHKVDFDEAMRRTGMYKPQEEAALEAHICRLEAVPHGR